MRTVALILFVIMSTAASGQILNGGFEDWTDDKPDHWEALFDFSTIKIAGLFGNAACSVHSTTWEPGPTALHGKTPFQIPNDAIGFSIWFSGRTGSFPFVLQYSVRSMDTTLSVQLPNSDSWSKITVKFPKRDTSKEDSLLLKFLNMDWAAPNFTIDELKFDKEQSEVEELEDQDVHLYPNPISSNGIIKFTVKEFADISIGLFDLFGGEVISSKTVHCSPGRVEFPFSVESIPQGVYYIRYICGNNSMRTYRIVVLH
jgi:hypothetical protein